MANSWRSFLYGWRAATRLWPVVLLLYLVDTALALILAIPPANRLAELFGHSTMASELVGPVTLNLAIEATGGLEGFPLPYPLYLLVPVLFALVSTFLRGGTLGTLAAGGASFRWAAFFSDCARHFGRLLLLLLFFIPGLIVVTLLFLLANLLLSLVPMGENGVAAAASRPIVLGFLFFLLLTTLDYARVSLALEPERSLPRHVGRAIGFLVRRFPWVVLLGLSYLLAFALIAAAYPALLQIPFFGAFLPALLTQQLVALLASWQRVAVLGGEMDLYRAPTASFRRG